MPVEEGPVLLAFEAVGDGGDVAEPDRGPAFRTDDHEAIEVTGPPALVVETDEHRGLARLDRSDGELQALRGHRVGEIAKAQAELAHGRGRDLDPDLVLREAPDGHLGHPRDREQIVLHPFGVGLQALGLKGPRDSDERDEVRTPELAHDRGLGRVGEIGNGVDLRLHVVEEAIEIAALAHHEGGDGHPLAGIASGLVAVVDTVRRVLDPLADGLLDIDRRRAGEGDAHLDRAGRDVGKRLALDGRRERETDDEKGHHQQVGGRGVVGEIPEHRPAQAGVIGPGCSRPPRRRGRPAPPRLRPGRAASRRRRTEDRRPPPGRRPRSRT